MFDKKVKTEVNKGSGSQIVDENAKNVSINFDKLQNSKKSSLI